MDNELTGTQRRECHVVSPSLHIEKVSVVTSDGPLGEVDEQILKTGELGDGLLQEPEVLDVRIPLWCDDKCIDHLAQGVFLLEMAMEEEGVKLGAQVDFLEAIWFGQDVEVFACSCQVDQRRAFVLDFLDDRDHDIVWKDNSHVDGSADSRQGQSRDNLTA